MTNHEDVQIPEPMSPKIILERGERGVVRTNVPHLVTHHSPTGFEFGYGGSGPADLALNIREAIVRELGLDKKGQPVELWDGTCSVAAWAIHQDFKSTFVATVDQEAGGTIDYELARNWVGRLLGAS